MNSLPTPEDLAAVKLLFGGDGESFAIAIKDKPFANDGRHTWDILSSSGGTWRVEERPDTKNGGTYLFCPCPGWKFQMGKGKLCRHAQKVADNLDFEP